MLEQHPPSQELSAPVEILKNKVSSTARQAASAMGRGIPEIDHRKFKEEKHICRTRA